MKIRITVLLLSVCLSTVARGETWTLSKVDMAGDVGRYASVATRFGRTHIAYYDLTNKNLKYATSTDNLTWSIAVVDSVGDVGEHASLAVDVKGNPHISYYDATNHDLKYAVRGASWQVSVVDANSAGQYSSIAVDSTYTAHISYLSSASFSLKYARGKPGNWTTQFVDAAGSVGWGSSIAVDANGFAHISYNDNAANTLRYATNTSGVWVITIVDNVNGVAVPTSIALDSLGTPHIAYLRGGLRYAYKSGGIWNTEAVDATIGFEEWGLSIRMNAANLAVISYHDGVVDDLKLARRLTNNTWDKIVIDADGAGMWSSVAIDNTGRIRIAYFNAAADLRYAIN